MAGSDFVARMRRCLIASIFVATPLAAALGFAQARAADRRVSGPSNVGPSGVELASLDRTADACTDFYQFACGGWLANHPLPADSRNYGRVQEVRDRNDAVLRWILERPGATGSLRRASDYYAACVDTATIEAKGIAPLGPDLARIDALAGRNGLPEVLAHLHRVSTSYLVANASASTFPFFELLARSDPADSRHFIATVRPNALLGLPDRDYYTKPDARFVKLRGDYRAHIARMLALSRLTLRAAESSADAVLRIETALAEPMLDRSSINDPSVINTQMTLGELQASTPAFDWARYLSARQAPRFSQLGVTQPRYVRRLNDVIANTPLDDIKSYLRWHLIHNAASMLPRAFVEAHFDFFSRTLAGQQEPQPRWRVCLNQTDEHLGDALGRAFVDETFRPEAKADMLRTAGALKAALQHDIEAADWMSDATKRAAMEKLEKLEARVGYPDTWRDDSALEVSRTDAFGNLQRVRASENARELRRIGQAVDASEWAITPPTANFYYSTDGNTVNFPAGILQPPFYRAGRDPAVNFGAAGSIIGHEMTHGFDNQGRKFDAHGNVRDWWTPADGKAFDDRAECFVNQYSAYSVSGDAHVNGQLTLGENIGDSGGLRLALLAYLAGPGATSPGVVDGFSSEQRLFLGYAQLWCENATPEFERLKASTNPHAANRYRVNGVVSNMPEFQRAFSCRNNAPMVRAQACRVW